MKLKNVAHHVVIPVIGPRGSLYRQVLTMHAFLLLTAALSLATVVVIPPSEIGAATASIAMSRGSQPATSKVRSVSAIPGRSLLNELRDDDLVLEVHAVNVPFDPVVPPPDVSLAEWRTRMADFVVLVSVEAVTGRLTADQSFVVSEVRARVEEVLKQDARLSVRAKEALTFSDEGGEVAVGHRRIVAKKPGAKPFENARRYLIFGSIHQGNVVVSSGFVYELVDDRLRPMLIDNERDTLALAPSAKAVVADIRGKSSLAKPRLTPKPPRF